MQAGGLHRQVTGLSGHLHFNTNLVSSRRPVCCLASRSATSSRAGRRRRATTKRLNQGDDAEASVHSAPSPARSRAASRRTSAGPSDAPDSVLPSSSAATQPEATMPAAAAAAAAPATASRRTRSPTQQQHKQQTSAPSAAAAQQSHKQRSAQLEQEVEPPHICYSLNPAVGSYSDFNRCTVHLDDEEGWGNSQDNGSNGSSSSGSNHTAAGDGRNGNGRMASRPDSDDVRGLVYGATVRFSDSAALRLRRRAMVVWEQAGPRKVLIVKKPVAAAATTLRDMATWLQKRGLQVFVERAVHASEFPDLQPFDPTETQVDFAITLGGDGTVLHLASLFAEDTPLPPVMCFAMGTLGFLTPFDAAQFRSCLARVLAANRRPLYCTLRTRKRCAVLDADGKLRRVHHILNECVIDRGAFPSSVYLELYIDGCFVTAAEADGLIIATPSGSTAYSMSAGGSMVAPSVPCTLITPLSPHSLSFRPLIIPENAELMIRLPENARSHARASFDGKHPMRIARGCSVHFQTSLCPLPLINIASLDVDWYEGITRKLKWNQSIRGVPSVGLETAILQQAAAAAAAAGAMRADLQPQLSLGGLVQDLTAAAHNEAKVANWVEEALLEDVSRN